MASPIFPKKRADGTFSILVLFDSTSPPTTAAAQAWLASWSSTNAEWVRHWRGRGNEIVSTDVMRLTDAFVRDPYLASWPDAALAIRLDATPGAPFWKDWMARLVQESIEHLPGLVFKGAVQVD